MEKRIDANGVSLSLLDEGNGPAILFVHGLSGYKENWQENFGHFAATNHAIAVDLPGFGDSEKRADLPYTIEFFADTLCAVLDKLGIERAHWVGNSMGGHISAFAALKYPARVDHLVLVNAAGVNQGEMGALLQSKQSFLPDPAALPSPELVDMMVRNFIFFGPSPHVDSVIARAIADHARPDAPMRQQASMKALQSIITTTILERLGDITAPTLVVWGKEDRLVSLSNGETFAAGIPGARLHAIDQCGHCPMLEKPEEFNRVVGEFLAAG